MGFYIVQGGSTLNQMTPAGVATALTLPTGVAVNETRRMYGVVVNGLTVLVNSPSEAITVDRFGVVRILCPRAPTTAPILSAVAGGSLTGSYQAWMTYYIKDVFGNLIAESDFSPASNTQAVTAQFLGVVAPVSPQSVTGRRFYRSTTGPGLVKFPWFDIEDNTLVTAMQDDMSDASLSLIAAATDLGAPPNFKFITDWKDRLWGASSEQIDSLHYSGINRPYAFGAAQVIIIPPKDRDAKGITGFLARKNELGVGRVGSLQKILSNSTSTSFSRDTVVEGIGIWATDSARVIQDVGYWLGNPYGVYSWGPGGIQSISNERVRAWFETDTYFNRAEFANAIGCYDPALNSYILCLSAVGSTVLDRWIMYDITAKTWWGPHKTGEFTITGCATLRDANDVPILVLCGSDGKLYKPRATKTDGAATAIDLDCESNFYSAGTPDIHKTWLQPTLLAQTTGTIVVTPRVGDLAAAAQTAINYTATERAVLRHLGDGRFAQLRLRENTNGANAIIRGYELPYFENGRR